ncbi:hypothetical protein CCAX7_007430 [Capsulimonas corticalis]|uniref:Siroheme decarboxylase AsnC-like ligand binding domain-containing protein n=1 Tax=Capsulimonas corticalis TaxID=2219043 RepID=A0A402D1M6_9BACT|nr:Lrp/AsnC family transcriptional regulator [Capsulimonas corticalis]BDI28692.1 hypothetical protein CCAX7_007430 [Capsulimonas corticalis]
MRDWDTPTAFDDPVNASILAIGEDRLRGFQPDPFGQIAAGSGVEVDIVIERVRAMLRAGVIRRVRQTLLSINLAQGALAAWKIPESRLEDAFDYMFREDPFSGHVVIRSTDAGTPGAQYRLWTTIKTPQGFSLERHAEFLAAQVGAESYRLMPARRLFVLGVGHVRRKGLAVGDCSEAPADAQDTNIVTLSDRDWRVLGALKREFTPEEIVRDLWSARIDEANMSRKTFYAAARSLDERGVIGRFSTFLEHVKPADGRRVTRYNALFHWAVPEGREIEAGLQIGRFPILTHAYWREAGPEFGNVNLMAVAHGQDKDILLAHKASMDAHLANLGIPVHYTSVFWGGRSEIKPSEITPEAYRRWSDSVGLQHAPRSEEALRR